MTAVRPGMRAVDIGEGGEHAITARSPHSRDADPVIGLRLELDIVVRCSHCASCVVALIAAC